MILDQGIAGSVIYLPGKQIKLPSIKIRKHFKIIGEPGTRLIFEKSTLTFDRGTSEQKKNEEINFKDIGTCLFSQIQFCFIIDMKEIAYKSRASSSKYSPVNKTDNAGRTKVPLIIIGDSSKIEFRDCSFKAHKIYKQDKSPKKISQKKQMKNNSNVSNKHKEGSVSSISKNNKLGHFQDSISLAPSAIAENDGSSSKNVKNSRLLGKYF